MFAKHKYSIIVILIFISSIQLFILIFNTTQDYILDTQPKQLIFHLNRLKNIDEISRNDQYFKTEDETDSLFDDKDVTHINENIEMRDNSMKNSEVESTSFKNTETLIIPSFLVINLTYDKTMIHIDELQTAGIQLFSNTKKYFDYNISLITKNITDSKRIKKFNTTKYESKKIKYGSARTDNETKSLSKRKLTSNIKKPISNKTMDRRANSSAKVNKHHNREKPFPKYKDKFIYNENDKYIQNLVFTNYSYQQKSKKMRFFDVDENEFAEEALANNNDEELPFLDESAITNQQQINFQNLFTNDSVKVISMSLFGDQKRYTVGAIKNAELIKIYFPGWKLRIYMEHHSLAHHGKVPRSIVEQLQNLDVEILYVDENVRHMQPMMWRFLIADDPAVDVFLIRDSDSRLNERDAAATHAWLQTKTAFYCTRDHPSHAGYSISGGLWGGRVKLLKKILRRSWLDLMLSDRTSGRGGYFVDMAFLQNRIWKKVVNYAYCSDSVSCDLWTNARPFPLRRRGYEHVGQVFDENENARPIDIRIMRRTGENKNCLPSN